MFCKTLTITGVILLSFLMGGCALLPKKPKVPPQLESEIRSIEGQNSSMAYQPVISGGKKIHIVKKGDTLWHISKNYGVSVEAILSANHLTNIKELEVGQKLVIPVSGKSNLQPVSYPGFTPAGISHRGVSSKGFIWPVKGQIVLPFGGTRNGVKNMGIYILPEAGQKIVAAKKGVVEAVSDDGYGMYAIVIKHEGGVRTMYGCRSNPVVGEGSYVEQGQPIAGIESKPHEVSFKIYVKDKPVNPMAYLP